MKIKCVGSYPSKTTKGDSVFVYHITGTDEEIAKYREIKGNNFKTDEVTGKPIYWSSRFFMPNTELKFNYKGTGVYPDTAAFDQAAAMTKQYGGNFGQVLGQHFVEKLLSGNTAMPSSLPQGPIDEGEENHQDPASNADAGDSAKIDQQ